MSGEFRVVPMRAEHVATLAEIERLCFASPWSENAIREELENPGAAFFTALDEADGPAGYAGMFFVLDEGYVANVAVHPAFRRRGAAAALLGAMKAFSLQEGLATLSLEVRVTNEGAIRLYEREGFLRMGIRPGFYEKPAEDALIMTLPLRREDETETEVRN